MDVVDLFLVAKVNLIHHLPHHERRVQKESSATAKHEVMREDEEGEMMQLEGEG